MQNPIQKFRQSSIVFEKQVFCLKIWKLWRALTILQFNIFYWNFAHVFYLPMSTSECVGLFKFYLDLELFAKIKKDLVSSHSIFTLLLITQNLNKIKKSRTAFCRHYEVENVSKISAKNIKLCGSWSLSNFSIFQTKKLVFWKW